MSNKDAYWFTHDSNAKDDPKIMLLMSDLKAEGYGIYWVLIEILRDQPEYKYPIKLVPIIANRYYTTAESMLKVINDFELFEIDNDGNFYSISLIDRMKPMDDKREKCRQAGIRSGKARRRNATPVEPTPNGRSTPVEPELNGCPTSDEHITLEYSTVDKNTVKDNTPSNNFDNTKMTRDEKAQSLYDIWLEKGIYKAAVFDGRMLMLLLRVLKEKSYENCLIVINNFELALKNNVYGIKATDLINLLEYKFDKYLDITSTLNKDADNTPKSKNVDEYGLPLIIMG